jgi:hypothetical protein
LQQHFQNGGRAAEIAIDLEDLRGMKIEQAVGGLFTPRPK